jgi:hypothetical protein
MIIIDQTRVATKYFESKQKGRRKMGRRKLKLVEDAENDL